ncbi:hypothetical protein DRJ24_06095 [Candidatus Acetothermia bacterium]|nr:MAG: hypothetical protein DRJ24_06095 [Candidatus Acetothermia bacterium]
MGITAILLTLGSALSWALTSVLMKLGLERMSRIGFAAIRPWMGLLFIIPYAFLTKGLQFGSAKLILVASAGSFLNAFLGTALFYYAISNGPLHRASILSNTSPFWAVASAVIVLHEPPTLASFIAAGLVVLGAYLMFERKGSADGRRILPVIAALGAGALLGFASAVPTKYCLEGGMSPIAYELLFAGSAGIWWGIVVLPGLVRKRISVTRSGLFIALLSAFFGYFAGWILWLTALRHAPASLLSPISGTSVLFTVLMSIAFLGERLTIRTAIGGVLAFAAVIIVSLFG